VRLVASWETLRTAVVVIAIIALVIDVARILQPALHSRLTALLPVCRDTERRRLSGATWLWFGYALAVWAPAPGPAAGILVAALADPAASLVGERFEPHDGKTWPGAAAAATVAYFALLALRVPWSVALAGATVAALVERWSGPVDDNLLVAPAVAAAVAFLA
jgi:dolichol kinase